MLCIERGMNGENENPTHAKLAYRKKRSKRTLFVAAIVVVFVFR